MPTNRTGAEASKAEGSRAFSQQEEAADIGLAMLRWTDRLGGEDNSFPKPSVKK